MVDLYKKIKTLENEIDKLKDENEILWFLLDEIEKRYTNNSDFKEIFNEIYKESRYQTLMKSKFESEA